MLGDDGVEVVKVLNSYFGYGVKSAAEFKREFKKDILPEVQAENLLNFILHLERRERGYEQFNR